MNLPYFSKEALKALRAEIDNNETNYYSQDPWLGDFFSSRGIQDYLKTSSIVVPDIKLVCSGVDDAVKCGEDFINVTMLYGDYKDRITPLQASDPSLWTALSHTVFRDYVIKRWGDDSGKVSIAQRFFATEGRSSLCYYNAISRLWWAGYLSYDKDMESVDPWHLTKTLLSAQQVFKDFSDQGFSMSRSVSKGLLLALKRVQEETGNKATRVFRLCCDSFLNHRGAVTVLDVLWPEEIESIAYEFMSSNLTGKDLL